MRKNSVLTVPVGTFVVELIKSLLYVYGLWEFAKRSSYEPKTRISKKERSGGHPARLRLTVDRLPFAQSS